MIDDSGVRMSIPYNPSAKGVGWSFGVAVSFGMLQLLFPWFRAPLWLLAEVVFVLFSVLLFLRRSVWKRVLTVTDDALIVPTGFLRLQPARLVFANIRRVSVVQLYRSLYLRVSTDERTVEIMDLYLPDRQMFLELKRVLESSSQVR